jgi:hypothetical protein
MWQKRPFQARAIGRSAETAAQDVLNGKILLFWVLAFTAAGFYLRGIVDSPAALTARFSIDDSFYYFETAWQTRLNGFVTFDGLHPTNGVHFLWFAVLSAVAWLSPGKLFLLYAAYGVSLLLVLGVYWGIWRVGTLVEDTSRLLTLLLGLFWTFLLSDRVNLFFVGMESTLHMAMLWGALAAGLTLLRAARESSAFPGRQFLVFTLWLVLVTWTRLDSAVFTAALYLYALAMLGPRRFLHEPGARTWLAASLAIAGVGAAMQIAFFLGAGGTVLPVSALVKASGMVPGSDAGIWERVMSVVFPMTPFIAKHTPLHFAVELALFAALLYFAVRRAVKAPPPLRHYYGIAAALGGATVVYAALVSADHEPFWRWYLSPVYLFYGLTIAGALREAREGLRWRLFRLPLLAASVGVFVSFCFIVLFFATYTAVPHFLARAQLGLFLKQVTAEDDVLAAFNAGQLAFFSERRTVNLDGLVNDRRYLETILGNPDALAGYLRESGVHYAVDYDFYWGKDTVEGNTTVSYTFPVPDDHFGRVLYVRRMGNVQ